MNYGATMKKSEGACVPSGSPKMTPMTVVSWASAHACTKFPQVSVAASIQMYLIYILGKCPCVLKQYELCLSATTVFPCNIQAGMFRSVHRDQADMHIDTFLLSSMYLLQFQVHASVTTSVF